MRFSPSNRFKFTMRHIETKIFYENVAMLFAKDKINEYNKNNTAVYDYIMLKDPHYAYKHSVLFRIIRPRYQIAYKDKYGKIYYGENVYETFKQASSALAEMTVNRELPETHKYYVETISYLDEEL